MTRFELPAQRKIKHLTLHREERRISITEYQTLSPAVRLEMIRQAYGKKKYDLILNAPDAETLVPQLHPQDIYLTVHEIGSEYASELLMLASTEQLTTLFDLDLWEGDEISGKSALHWLQLLLEAGEEVVCRLLREMEPELPCMMLKKLIRVTRGPEAYDDDDAENANRLEGLYDIEYGSEEVEKTVSALLSILLRREQPTYLLLLEMVRSELATTLEEEVFQQRSNRLLDIGLTTPHEARAIYNYVDPDSFEPVCDKRFDVENEGLQHPGALLARAQPPDLLAEILVHGLNPEQATELAMLANRKMSADRVDLSDSKAVGESLNHLYQTLNLGLEKLTARDSADARKLFDTCYLTQIFQLGNSLTARLKRQAGEFRKSAVAPYLDGPYRRFLEALTATPPKLFCGVRLRLNQDEKEFQHMKDLQLAEEQLQQVAIQQQLFNGLLPFSLPDEESFDLDGCQPERIGDLTLSDLYLTALANRLLGRDFAPQPIPANELADLHALVSDNKQLSAGVRDAACADLESVLSGAGQFAEFCLELWNEEFCALEASALDPRYLGGLIVRLS